jgi:hypothetical protein
MHLCLLFDKAEALDVFKTYKVEVKKKYIIKFVRSDRGGEYYDRYMKNDKYQIHLQSALKKRTL